MRRDLQAREDEIDALIRQGARTHERLSTAVYRLERLLAR